MTPSRRIFLNILATYGRQVFTLACSIVSSRWTLMVLGKENYGLVNVVGSMVVFITFFNNLFSGAIGRYLGVSVGVSMIKGKEIEGLEEGRCWFNTAVSVHTVIPLILMLIGYHVGIWAIQN